MDDVDHLLCENVAKDDFKWIFPTPPLAPYSSSLDTPPLVHLRDSLFHSAINIS